MKYLFTLYGELWSGDDGVWVCAKTSAQLRELANTDELNDDVFDECAKKLAKDFGELIDYSVDRVETIVTPIKFMSDENFEKVQDIEGITE